MLLSPTGFSSVTIRRCAVWLALSRLLSHHHVPWHLIEDETDGFCWDNIESEEAPRTHCNEIRAGRGDRSNADIADAQAADGVEERGPTTVGVGPHRQLAR